jgi:hypothetical protein
MNQLEDEEFEATDDGTLIKYHLTSTNRNH